MTCLSVKSLQTNLSQEIKALLLFESPSALSISPHRQCQLQNYFKVQPTPH